MFFPEIDPHLVDSVGNVEALHVLRSCQHHPRVASIREARRPVAVSPNAITAKSRSRHVNGGIPCAAWSVVNGPNVILSQFEMLGRICDASQCRNSRCLPPKTVQSR